MVTLSNHDVVARSGHHKQKHRQIALAVFKNSKSLMA